MGGSDRRLHDGRSLAAARDGGARGLGAVGVRDERESADVVVVGSGGAALAAALTAHDAGARVVVVERTEHLGGTTAVSGGGVWMPQNHHMAEMGIADSRAEALAYCGRLSAGRTPPELLETFVDRGPGIIAELEARTPLRLAAMTWPDYHPEMEGAKLAGRMLEPRLHRRAALGPLAAKLRPAPVLGLPMTLQESTVDWRPSYSPERYEAATIKDRVGQGLVACGQALIAALLEACLTRGIELRTETRVRELMVRGGRVSGVAADVESGRLVLDSGAVVLATGGYEWNQGLKDRFMVGPLTHPSSPPANEGDGLVMAMEVGADLANMTEAWWYPAGIVPGERYEGRQLARFVGTERTAPHSIIVNRFGQRFVDEAANYNDMQKAFWFFDADRYENRNLPCWVVFDHQYRSRYPVLTVRPSAPDPDWLHVDDTLDGLAVKAGIDPEGLRSTVERWNGFVGEGTDRDFRRGQSAYDRFHGDPGAPHPNLGTIERGPFYALDVHTGTVGTKGGPRTTARGEVLHVRDRPVPGLYAAGNVMASPAGPAYFGGGTSIGMGLVWGHLCGVNAAAHARRPASGGSRT